MDLVGQAVFGQHGPSGFGWSASPSEPSRPASEPFSAPAPSSHTWQPTALKERSLDRRGGAISDGATSGGATSDGVTIPHGRGAVIARSKDFHTTHPAPTTHTHNADAQPTGAGAGFERIVARPDGAAGGLTALLGGAWEAWWEEDGDGHGEDGVDGDEVDGQWRGVDAATQVPDPDGAVELRLMEPKQGQHIVCGGPGCAIPLEFAVEGQLMAQAGASAFALLKINRQEAARFEDASHLATSLVDLAISWHVLELHVTVKRAGGPDVQLADARSFRVVHMLSLSHRGAVSFGSRGGCRLMQQGNALSLACVVRPLGWTAESGWEGEEALVFPVPPGAGGEYSSAGMYASAAAAAEHFDLGRIEALAIWQCMDRYATKHLLLQPAAAPAPRASRWAVMASNGNTDYAFYLPIVALIWSKVMGYRPLVLLVGRQWREPASDSRQAAVLRALLQVGTDVKVHVIASDDSLNTAAVAQVSPLASLP